MGRFKKILFILAGTIIVIISGKYIYNLEFKEEPPENIQQNQPKQPPSDIIKGFKTNVNLDDVKAQISAEISRPHKPVVTPFTPFEAEYVVRLDNVNFKGVSKNKEVVITAEYAITVKDFTKLKFYKVKSLKIDGKEVDPKKLENKKVVVFLKYENKNLVVSIEEI